MLTPEQQAQLPALLAPGAESHGFRGDVWTARRIGVVIQRAFGVHYHPSHVNHLVRTLGLSVQQPEVRATPRDPAKVEAWLTERWPVLEKKPTPRGAPSSGLTKPASPFSPPGSGPMRPGDTPRS